MKTVGLYSPYIPKHAGGGERYLLSIAQVAADAGHETLLLVPPRKVNATKDALQTYGKTFGLDLSALRVRGTTLGSSRSPLSALRETRLFDVLFAMTDGSFFPTMSRKSYLIMQVPWTRPLSVAERIKLSSWTSVLVYSSFVQKVLRSSWKTHKTRVVAPYVDLTDFTPSKKEKLIVNTGRFFAHSQSNSKRQDILITAFSQLVERYHLRGWHLALIGNVDPNYDSRAYVESLRELARGYHVSIHTNLSYDSLRAYYARASMYWHAAGYGIDQVQSPENTEHFGITTLEAMASGAIPLVVPKGGQVEVVDNDELYWESVDDLVQRAQHIISLPTDVKHALRTRMRSQAEKFSKDRFTQLIRSLL